MALRLEIISSQRQKLGARGSIVLEAPVPQVDRHIVGRSMAGHVT